MAPTNTLHGVISAGIYDLFAGNKGNLLSGEEASDLEGEMTATITKISIPNRTCQCLIRNSTKGRERLKDIEREVWLIEREVWLIERERKGTKEERGKRKRKREEREKGIRHIEGERANPWREREKAWNEREKEKGERRLEEGKKGEKERGRSLKEIGWEKTWIKQRGRMLMREKSKMEREELKRESKELEEREKWNEKIKRRFKWELAQREGERRKPWRERDLKRERETRIFEKWEWEKKETKSKTIGVLTVLIFDPFLFHFCRHRPSKMNWKMRTVNQPPLKFWKMSEKMSEKWNSTFSAPWQPWTLHLMAGPAPSYHFPNAFCQPQIFLESLLIGLQSIKSFLS